MCGGSSKGPKQSEAEKMLGKLAVEKWNDSQSRFRPIENQYIEDVQMTDSDYSQARGQAHTSVQQNFSEAEKGLADNIFMSGLDPSDSSFVKAIDGLGIDKGLSMGAGVNEANTAVQKKNIAGLQSVVALGQGQSSNAVQGMSDIAMDSTRKAIDRSRASHNERQAGLNLAGQVIGAGTAYHLNQNRKDRPNE